jgi:hypothetical protein
MFISTYSMSVSLSVCLSVCMSVSVCLCLSVCLSACLSVRLSVCPSVCLSVCKHQQHILKILAIEINQLIFKQPVYDKNMSVPDKLPCSALD